MAAPVERPLRVAILENDTPQPDTQARYKSYGGVFIALLTAASAPLTLPEAGITITAHDVVSYVPPTTADGGNKENHSDPYPSLDEVDAILLTGSKHTAFHDDPWILRLVEYVREALRRGVRVVGVCFGHQIVGRAVGAVCAVGGNGWEVSVTETDLTDKGKEIFGLEKLRIHQMHRDIVETFPADAIPLGSNQNCAVQAMYSPGKYITVQGHPEFTQDIITEILERRHGAGIFPDDVYDSGIKRASLEHDGVTVGKAFINFMRHG